MAGRGFAIGLLAFVWLAAAQPPAADLILVNGSVFTGEPGAPRAQAVAIAGDRIAAVGADAEVRRQAGPSTRVIDVGGRLVIPGLNDAHTHVGASPPRTALSLRGDDPTFDDVLAALRAAVTGSPPDRWITGTIGERVLSDPRATRAALDEAAPGRLVKLSAWTGHGQVFSTAAMRALNVGDRDPDPPFGRYGRTSAGDLNGVFEEYADVRANRALTALAPRAVAIDSLRRQATEAVELGVTTIQAMANSLTASALATLLPEANTPIRWRIIRFPITLDPAGDRESLGPLPKRPSPLVTVSGTKWILDGTPVERLSALAAPYADRDGWSGRMNMTPAEVEAILRRGLDTGDQVLLHVTGDRSIEVVLATMERLAPPERWRPLRVRFEHGEFVSGSRLVRTHRLGIVVVQNPAHFTIGDLIRARLGPDRAAAVQTIKAIVAEGVPFALGGDGLFNPFVNMMLAIQHPANPSQALTREDVVRAYTFGSAYAEFAEDEKGTLVSGQLADIAVLTQDVFAVDAARLPETRAALTIVGGRVVHDTLAAPR